MKAWLTINRLKGLIARSGDFAKEYKTVLERVVYDLDHAKCEAGVYVAYADVYEPEVAYQLQKWGCHTVYFQHWSGDESWEVTLPDSHEEELENKKSAMTDWDW